MSKNSLRNYSDYVIRDIQNDLTEYKQFSTLPNTPLMFTLEGPPSLKKQTVAYKVEVEK